MCEGEITVPAAVLENIAGWVPPRVVANAELPAAWGVDDPWVRRRTGIATRHWAGPGVTTGDLALTAAGKVLASSGRPPLDAILVASSTGDQPMPAMAPWLATRLGYGGVAAWDLSAACTGFVYGLASAVGLLTCGVARRVLLVAAEVYSTLVHPDDRGAGVVFADGAAAVLLRAAGPAEPAGTASYGRVLGFDLGSDGAERELIQVAAGGARERAEPGRFGPADRYFRMRGREVFQHAVTRMTESSAALLARTGWAAADIDRFVTHQANARILTAVGERLDVPSERHVTNIERVGNTGAASIPLALADAASRGELRAGERVLATAFGAGLTWGSTALVWPELPPVEPVTAPLAD
ncbi:3-oxoacyl-ACP synthase III family protein [Streptomyces sp. NPDC060194]|uniref:3-oxoacyl-ACP synthase III family protein n=1 Tax=Streptomyces sp. NPDC060194 TaxID=3347069 RepID=UPI00364A64AE